LGGNPGNAPLDFVRSKDLPLGVVADDLDIDEAAKIQLFGAEHRHRGGWGELGVEVPFCSDEAEGGGR